MALVVKASPEKKIPSELNSFIKQNFFLLIKEESISA
jgi:hypothetical protein